MRRCYRCHEKIRFWTSYHEDTDLEAAFHTDCLIERLQDRIDELEKELDYLTKYSGKKARNMSFEEYMNKVDKGEINKKDEPTKTLH